MLTFLTALKKSVEILYSKLEEVEHKFHAKMILEDIDQGVRMVEAAISTPKLGITVNTETKTDSNLQEPTP